MDCTVHGVAELDMTGRLSLHSHRSFVLENRCFTTLCQLLLCSKLSQLDTYTCWAVSLSRVCPFVTLWTVARQAPLSMGFSRPEYWSGSPCLSPGDLPDPGIKAASLMSPALAGSFFTNSATWEAPV